MKLQTGIITEKLAESRDFYQNVFGFERKFESDWFVLLSAPGRPENELALMLPHQKHLRLQGFQRPYSGGTWLILESGDIDAEYKRVQAMNIPFALELTREEWGDSHFTVLDPNGIAVDVVAERDA